MTVGATLAEAVSAQGEVGRRQRAEEVDRLLDLVALDFRYGSRFPPEVLIADEITSALDASVQGAILNLLRDIQRRLNLTVLFISHNLAVVRYVSDTIAVMYQGKLVEQGDTDTVIANPRDPYTKMLLDSVPQRASK